jgi:hypothetical protein
MNDKNEVCSICNGNDYIYDPIQDTYDDCLVCTMLGKLYEAEEIKNETRTETISTHHWHLD